MVRLFRRVPALDRKLLRDLWEIKGQAFAIAAVIAAGVTMFVTYLSNFDSLQRTRAEYYERARFADVFASLTRQVQRVHRTQAGDEAADAAGHHQRDGQALAPEQAQVPQQLPVQRFHGFTRTILRGSGAAKELQCWQCARPPAG